MANSGTSSGTDPGKKWPCTEVTAELMDAIVTRHQPLGEALRDLRAKHGAVSPTFYSYLLYGDVTAQMGAA